MAEITHAVKTAFSVENGDEQVKCGIRRNLLEIKLLKTMLIK